MRFHALLPVRDEADIISQSLHQALLWADSIHIFDTGSVDDTWEQVLAIATHDPRVIPLGKRPVYFNDTLVRGWMFHQARTHMSDGDWFLRLDADEFHHILPPEFVRTRLRKHETIVYHQYYDFHLTTSEVADWEAGRESVQDRSRPIADRRRHYTISHYSEPRLCRYRSTMKWPPHVSFPYNAGYVARERLPIRHYPHRDPAQLERRCRLRAIMMADATNRSNWSRPDQHHWTEREWRKLIVPDALPGMKLWRHGDELPSPGFQNHIRSWPVRSLQRILHSCFLPVLDRMRQSRTFEAQPLPLPPEVIRRLEQELVD